MFTIFSSSSATSSELPTTSPLLVRSYPTTDASKAKAPGVSPPGSWTVESKTPLVEVKSSVPLSHGVDPTDAFDERREEVGLSLSERKAAHALLRDLTLPLKFLKMNPRRSPTKGNYYRGYLGSVTTLTTSAAGVVNTTVSNSGLSTTADFPSFAACFDEFFVIACKITYKPLNKYQTQPLMSFAAPASGVLLIAPLYHGAATYATTAAMANNYGLRTEHSGNEWSFTWRNNETPKSTVLTSPETSTPVATQAWCLTAATPAALYSGRIQLRNNFAFTGATSATIGDIVVRWDVLFRARV